MKIICIGHNYEKHNHELLGGYKGEPVFFLKPETALLRNHAPFYYPNFTQDLQYEVELVLRIDKLGRSISPKFAARYYTQVGIGIDFTARDLQAKARAEGLPWESSKAFDYSAPISPEFIALTDLPNPKDIQFSLELNGKEVQKGRSAEMIFDFDTIISHLSQYLTLKIGDLIFTGTPHGVGSVKIGDQLTARLEGKTMLSVEIK
ncbi:MAG: fumarylacetoacetate hydrolase family protein [Bacteroidales bacterium]